MDALFRFAGAVRRDAAVEDWLNGQLGDLGVIAHFWFETIRGCSDDVREILHDGRPTACAGDAAFAYVDVHRAHVAIGFFRGAALPDPAALLEGTGRFMRHVKIRPGRPLDAGALTRLIRAAHADMRVRMSEIGG